MKTDMQVVAIVGAGAIGCSWAALALAHGMAVHLADPNDSALDRARGTISAHLADLDAPADAGSGLTVHHEATAAAGMADLVIESGPERLDFKRELFAALDAAAAPDVVLASSSSGFGPSSFQDACMHPERVLVAHPFNPPHLIPLVEIVGGRSTSAETIDTAMTAMRTLGRRPIRVNAELPGHVVNRLQAALWREAYDLVGRGAISVADLDLAVANGPGLRWALLGPIATQHLSGGPGGMAHVLEHLGPPMVEWWNDLREPELDPELTAQLVSGVREELGGADDAVRARRDEALRELLALKSRVGLDGAGGDDA
ncbi:3-hydroxyacyl-CoA dehydrogenase [Flexivirga endophytica]|uniref:3-hydroxyacyl-CoA dehydrogenase n=1 Tax=Flexivirga endophytica TaxID=1849103 RepID=A0A916WX21_9MICO|nr:3-hydroxyacyl-CoA dehydrogenase NAD-binding domain-containing protein [Flexivirga endophytica]GGB37278.1 3-hydroxyacyl-CoA dehydrogenase [Flexivirga endophytica]GHB44882.1 3-hydroxyacyl-CoA dehydrogenase [Flexivirga endophytica]